VHASLLPRWRGVAPVERAILAGDAVTGVSLMVLDAGVDTGPVLATRATPVEPADNRVTLTARLALLGAELLVRHLDGYLRGAHLPVAQPAAGATYAPRLDKAEGRLDFSRPAPVLVDQVRGLYDWPGAFTTLGGVLLKVHGARTSAAGAAGVPGTIVAADSRHGVHVVCGEGAIELTEVQLPGKPRVAACDLAGGRVLRTGLVLGAP
jgi:methionyl-tRNA formyltransferase